MTRDQVLSAATKVVCDGQTTYGSPEDSFSIIAEYWSTYLTSCGVESTLDPYDVAIMMILLKVARLQTNPSHKDSWVDIAGYAACGAETLHDPNTAETGSKQSTGTISVEVGQ